MNSQGFTVIEMVCAFSIVAILAGLTAGHMLPTVKAASVRAEAQRAGQALTRARTLARSRIHCVAVTTNGTGLVLDEYASCAATPPYTPVGTPLTTETITLRESLTTVSISTGEPLIFLSSGGTNASATSVLQLHGPNNLEFQFSVIPAIGSVREGP